MQYPQTAVQMQNYARYALCDQHKYIHKREIIILINFTYRILVVKLIVDKLLKREPILKEYTYKYPKVYCNIANFATKRCYPFQQR